MDDLFDVIEVEPTRIKELHEKIKQQKPYDKSLKYDRKPSKTKQETSKSIELVSDVEKRKLRQEALEIYETLSLELNIPTIPKYDAPNTWSYYSVEELQRGDAMMVDGAVYVYLKKLAWWRNKTANVLVAQHHNPDAQKRVGEVDFVYGFKGYVQHMQLAKMGVEI